MRPIVDNTAVGGIAVRSVPSWFDVRPVETVLARGCTFVPRRRLAASAFGVGSPLNRLPTKQGDAQDRCIAPAVSALPAGDRPGHREKSRWDLGWKRQMIEMKCAKAMHRGRVGFLTPKG